MSVVAAEWKPTIPAVLPNDDRDRHFKIIDVSCFIPRSNGVCDLLCVLWCNAKCTYEDFRLP